MAADVFLLPIAPNSGASLTTPELGPGLRELVKRLGLSGVAQRHRRWALTVPLGPPGRPARVPASWTRAVATALDGPTATEPAAGAFCCDTLSITTKGLDNPADYLDAARAKGYRSANGTLPFIVGDDPQRGPSLEVEPSVAGSLARHTVASFLGESDGCCQLNPICPHPHLGFLGALSALGVGLADRAGKIALHQDIRPQVDTPLCAGCGACMIACLFDAINLHAGRAVIDHKACVGCGACMNMCFMAGIAPEDAAGVPRFQAKVAEAALMARRILPGGAGRWGHFNFVLALDRAAAGPVGRRLVPVSDVGVLASSDPVALDQATWDQLDERSGGLDVWSGFAQLPEALLARAAELGLGEREYRLRQI